MKTYVTFGTNHSHEIGNLVFNSECVAVIEGKNASENRAKAFELFGPKFAFEYPEEHWDENDLRYYSRGLIFVE